MTNIDIPFFYNSLRMAALCRNM